MNRPAGEVEASRDRHFAATIDLVRRAHPYYRRIISERGLAIGSITDLTQLPLTFKSDYVARPNEFVLEPTERAPEERVVWDTMYTAGTSGGTPTPFVSTAYDFYRTIALYERVLSMRGVGAHDIIANLCPLTVYPHGAYHRVMAAGAALKIPVVNFVPGRPSPAFEHGSDLGEVVRGIERTRATMLWGVASYVRRVLLAAAELRADFTRVRIAYVTGEPVTRALRTDFAQCLARAGAPEAVLHVSYGLTEIQGGFPECAPDSGFHNPLPEDIHVDIVDPVTHQSLPEGERGLVVVSHLNRRGTVLLRYATGDVSVLSRAPCPHCSATTERFVVAPRRADDLVKIKGMLVDPSMLEAAVLGVAGVAEYQATIERENPADPFSMDRLRVRVGGTAASEEIALVVKQAIGVTPVIEVVATAQLYAEHASLKVKRLVDKR